MGKKKGNYRNIAAGAIAAALVGTAFVQPASAASFKDVSPKYKEAVDFVVGKGVKGFSSSMFGIDQPIKRADAAVMVARVLGIENNEAKDSGFKDVPARAKKAVNALKEAGITSGKTETVFGSDDLITRGELAIWIQKAFELQGSAQGTFKDVSSVYKDAVGALVENKITSGLTKTEFGVTKPAKRGDFALFLHRADSLPGEFTLTVLHTNDTHANIDNAARKMTAIKEARAKNPNNVLLDAGDVFSGTLYFNLYKGQADLEFMNMAKYDAMTFGNHEFDEGTGTLEPFVKNAQFPFVSANVNFSKDALMNKYAVNDYTNITENGKIYDGIIKTINGEKVGIFGLTTAETATISSPGEVEFEDYIEAAEKSVEAFEKQGVNKIIALTHIGYDDGGGDNDLLLAEHVEGIDVIVGGHSHSNLSQPTVVEKHDEPTIIVQANEYTKFLGTLDVSFDKNGKVISHAGKLIDINAQVDGKFVIAEDEETAKILNEKYKPEVDKMKTQVVAETTVELVGGNPAARTKETNLGNLIADGMLAKAKAINSKTVIALQNGGGVRTTLKPGNITIADVQTVLPFGNALGIMELKGSELKEALEHSVSLAPAANGAFLQIAGFKYTYDSSKAAGSRVVSIEINQPDGTYAPFDENATYVTATNIFTAKGGDNYQVFKKAYEEGRVSEPGFVDWEVFVDYLEAQPDRKVSPVTEGRITDLAAQPE